jgi:hypothetical protein
VKSPLESDPPLAPASEGSSEQVVLDLDTDSASVSTNVPMPNIPMPNPTASSRGILWLGGNWQDWRIRAVLYTCVYLCLALVLVGIRQMTWQISPILLEVQRTRLALEQDQKALRSRVEPLLSPANIRNFALTHDMVPFSKAPKDFANFVALTPSADLQSAKTHVEVITLWK